MLDNRTDTLLMDAVRYRTRENGYAEAFRARRPLPLCPICRCNMSGDQDIPNVANDACENGRCACHAVRERVLGDLASLTSTDKEPQDV